MELVRVDRKYGVHGFLSNLNRERFVHVRTASKLNMRMIRLDSWSGDNVREEHGMTRVRIRKSPAS